jgi:hypothetical protein
MTVADVEYKQTQGGKVRGARPDAQVGNRIYLIKLVSSLRLTYQIRLLAFMAYSQKLQLVLRLPKDALVHESLARFVDDLRGVVIIERS